MTRKLYTPREDQRLLTLWRELPPGWSVMDRAREVARRMRRSAHSIRYRHYLLSEGREGGQEYTWGRSKLWSEEELANLRTLWHEIDAVYKDKIQQIAERLGRSRSAVQVKVAKLRLCSERPKQQRERRRRAQLNRREQHPPPPKPTCKPTPTTAPPGSADKVKVLQERLWSGQELWHPSDRREMA